MNVTRLLKKYARAALLINSKSTLKYVLKGHDVPVFI